MNKKEYLEAQSMMLNIYKGILFNNQQFENGEIYPVKYVFDCVEFETLKEKYNLESIAGKGTDFAKAKRLLHYLAPRLTHCSYYDNHIECNALALLEYSLDKPEQGINCLNKSKILEECCLALGIYARRVSIMPYSPYDSDNHVVCEIFDRTLNKWVMLDPTTDGLFVDENKTPLSIMEMRDRFANDRFITFVPSTSKMNDLENLREKYVGMNTYICKNLFYFGIGSECKFGQPERFLGIIPEGYSLKETGVANNLFRINNLPEKYKEMLPLFEKRLEEAKNRTEPQRYSVEMLKDSPLK